MGSYGVNWHGSRFEQYVGVIEELVHLEERRKSDPNAYRAFREDLGRQELLFEGSSQLLQLEISSKVWVRLDQTALARKLRKVSQGAPLPHASSFAADEARDTLVELQAAAVLADCGFEPQITNNDEDLRLVLAGYPDIFVECKRPVGDSLGTTVSKLRKQFWNRKKQGASVCMAVLATERVEGFAALSKAETSDEIDAEVRRRMEKVVNKVRRLCSRRSHALGALTPVALQTFSGALLVRRPTTHVYHFTVRRAFDTGLVRNTPAWLVKQFQHRAGILSEFEAEPKHNATQAALMRREQESKQLRLKDPDEAE